MQATLLNLAIRLRYLKPFIPKVAFLFTVYLNLDFQRLSFTMKLKNLKVTALNLFVTLLLVKRLILKIYLQTAIKQYSLARVQVFQTL